MVSPSLLQEQYAAATQPLGMHFAQIDAWLAEHEPVVWQRLHQIDDELFQLRRIGVSESQYQTALSDLLSLCEEAEQLYYEAHPSELSLPPLSGRESVAVYYGLSDGSLTKVSDEDE